MHVLIGGTPLYRIHRSCAGPWWFNRDGTRRFDLHGSAGTCATAATDEGAFIEVFGRTGLIDRGDVASRSLATLTIDRDLRLADLTAAAAAGLGMTATLDAGVPYDEHSQPWARLLWQAGFAGLRHTLRHDPTGDEIGYAIFGPGGANEFGSASSEPIAAELLFRCLDRWGLVLAP